MSLWEASAGMGMDAKAQQFYNSRAKIFAYLIATTLLLTAIPTLAVWKALLNEGSKHWLYLFIMFSVTYSFAALVIRKFTRKFKDRSPQISISTDGVFDPTISQETIPWESVISVNYIKRGRAPDGIQLKMTAESAKNLKLSEYWKRNFPYFKYVEICPILLDASPYRIFIVARDAFNQSKALRS